jgi:hypothetical protein
MLLSDIANIRLSSQHINAPKFQTAKELVEWMGAMQAQDYNMAKWAIGVRLSGSTDKTIQSAIDKGEIIRTHVLRPTWHFVAPADIYWMLELSAPRIKAAMRSRNKQLGLTQKIFTKSNSIIEKALADNKHLTRDELMKMLEKAKIRTDEYRSGHLMLEAELEGIVCSGAINGIKQTYALLEERIPKPKAISKEEALARLAEKYFLSRCPATLQDFIWWSGLSPENARKALEIIKSKLIAEPIGSQTFWLPCSFVLPKMDIESAYLLPAYDEFTISYKDRSASLFLKDQKKSISFNGIFKPTIAINGKITGIWKRAIKNDKVIIETQFFSNKDQGGKKSQKNLIKNSAARLGNFLDKVPLIR